MQPVDDNRRQGSAARNPAGARRVHLPKASALKLHQRMQQKEIPSASLSQSEGIRRFFGASPVASTLGVRSGTTPRELIHFNPSPCKSSSKQDISTLPGIGHFYFALTDQPTVWP